MVDEFKLGDIIVKPGEHRIVDLPVTVDLDGELLRLRVHVIRGERPGPTLTMLSALHGHEWFTTEMLRRFVRSLKPGGLAGTLMIVPVANPVAFQAGRRATPDDSDGSDLNRSYGGKFEWLTDQMARALETVLIKSDAAIDFHTGCWGSAMAQVGVGEDFSDRDVVSRSFAMAKAYGYPSICAYSPRTGFPGPRSTVGYCGEILKIPAIGVQIGGPGFGDDAETGWIEAQLRGNRNILAHMGMLDHDFDLLDRYLVWRTRWRANPTQGGYFEPAVGLDRQFTEVEPGEVLGRVFSPYTFELLEELKAPGPGTLFYMARDYMVRPGDWAFGVVRGDDGKNKWLAPDEF